ncbi:Alcohol dehydrogenase superfamily [Macleaya cordata]|uniref:Alcohol dehydrogenase superfamily n=1 Tax=Macleaya cordata TaxID=56857 RepID=A0A200QBG5_MACCD|nr:Alcohol dehydrogenase superfamily [Macleaya cordata]
MDEKIEMATEEWTSMDSREWILSAYAEDGLPSSNHLKLKNIKLDSIPDLHVAIQVLWLSVEPYLRSRMTGHQDGLYLPPFDLNQVVTTCGVGRVIRSKDGNYKEGDMVVNYLSPVAEYCVVPSHLLRKVDSDAGLPLPAYVSALGIPGFAAWVGIELLGKPKPRENVFISAAAGGVGMFAGQLAKLKGCRVIGSTGTDEKVKLLKEEFGYDDAFNYNKEIDLDAALTKYFPSGIDIYLDNVGGKMLEAVLNHINTRARIVACGMISQYNQPWSEREGVRNLLNIVGKEVRMEGFMQSSYLKDHFGEFAKEMVSYMKQGKITSKHKIYYGIESFLESLTSIFSSSNVGKVIIQVNKDDHDHEDNMEAHA